MAAMPEKWQEQCRKLVVRKMKWPLKWLKSGINLARKWLKSGKKMASPEKWQISLSTNPKQSCQKNGLNLA